MKARWRQRIILVALLVCLSTEGAPLRSARVPPGPVRGVGERARPWRLRLVSNR